MPTATQDQVLDTLRAERDQARDTAIALAEAPDFDPTADAFTALEARSASLDSQIERLVNLYGARQQADALDGRLSRAAIRTEQREQEGAPQSWGELFTRSEVFQQYPGRGTSSRLDLPEMRALPIGLNDLPASFGAARTHVDVTSWGLPTPLLDTMPTITVSQNAIDMVVWNKVAGGAAVVAEGAAKPSAEWAPTVTPAALETIAVWTQLTRQLIEDQGAVRDIINTELRREVQIREEALAAAALVAATLPTAEGGGDLMAGLRVGIAEVQDNGYSPNGALINPADWAAFDVALMSGTLNGPVIRPDYWGVKLIASSAQPAGTITVGDFRAGVQHYVRAGASIYVTDSHGTTFIENVFTLLCERRVKTVVTRPAALCEVTAGTAAVQSSRTTSGTAGK